MREQLQAIALDVRERNAAQEVEAEERKELVSNLQLFTTVLQNRIADFIQIAAELHIGSDTRLNDISESLSTDFDKEIRAEPEVSEAPAGVRTPGPDMQTNQGEKTTQVPLLIH